MSLRAGDARSDPHTTALGREDEYSAKFSLDTKLDHLTVI